MTITVLNAEALRTSTRVGSEKTTDSDAMNDRQLCSIINRLRCKIAESNGIDFKVDECTHKGPCPSDCEKMASDLEYLEGELLKIQSQNKPINIKGVFALNFNDMPETQLQVGEITPNLNYEKLEKLRQNPELANLPPRYLDNLLD